MSSVVSQQLMFEHLGEEVNVILHDGTSYWRRLIAVSEGKIKLAAGQDLSNRYPKTVPQGDIRSFGTREHGLLEEVGDDLMCECEHDLGAHPPDPEQPFAWPCRLCGCREYKEKKS